MAFQRRLRREALRLLETCEESQAPDGGAASATRTGAHAASVELHDVTVRGFRCFGAEPVTFSFRAAGIVALTGRNDMDLGASPESHPGTAQRTAQSTQRAVTLFPRKRWIRGVTVDLETVRCLPPACEAGPSRC